jgi:hypothetical protein
VRSHGALNQRIIHDKTTVLKHDARIDRDS